MPAFLSQLFGWFGVTPKAHQADATNPFPLTPNGMGFCETFPRGTVKVTNIITGEHHVYSSSDDIPTD